jgi:hypothetical protein
VKRLHGFVQLGRGVRVEPVARFVDEQHRRLEHERARQRRASAVESSELVRRTLQITGDPDVVEQPGGRRPRLVSADCRVLCQGKRDVLEQCET